MPTAGFDEHYEDDALNLFPYFSGSCYKGYNEDANGFYAVYRHVFETLAKEDEPHMDDPSDFLNVPTFGDSTSNYEEVHEVTRAVRRVASFTDRWTVLRALGGI